MEREKTIAEMLLRIHAVKVSVNPPFTWNTGLRTPLYTDNRLLISYPKERTVVINGFKELIAENNVIFDVIAGTATAGIPWAAFLAIELGKPMVYVRAQPKDYGAAKQVEGIMEKKSRVLIVEDLISTGRSSLTSAAACQREYDADVVAVIAIFNYQMEKAKQAFADARINLFSLSNFTTLITVAAEAHYLNEQEKQSALAWSNDPDAWHEAHR
ncbi:orotate phosphoribosyltransferase [Candidatus Falkowbacteria bacterium RIFOXYC2_FULL_47_12]|uniref:Orotate phosphoribosyltransferase n=2 Tax=Candidatus Falkowiibacteriota TaxID=1752728 RepID=A0A1F5TNI7_9BACT|nr:MAG: orotate phosphoribosyltransferase [Candidatus Falkowbacteria bacterium RIFOXYA2_FULL_47_9]OGF40428.1 MAG: orotate phosphoribosyltransferase [Candidatus Falkowbacteria bacterium RIFOXYC2_FULL_47_12]